MQVNIKATEVCRVAKNAFSLFVLFGVPGPLQSWDVNLLNRPSSQGDGANQVFRSDRAQGLSCAVPASVQTAVVPCRAVPCGVVEVHRRL